MNQDDLSEKSWDLCDLVFVHVNDFVNLYLNNIVQVITKYREKEIESKEIDSKEKQTKEIRRQLIICFSEWSNVVSMQSNLVTYLSNAWKCQTYPIFCPLLDQRFNIKENIDCFQQEVFAIEKRLARRFYIRYQVPYCQDFSYSMCFRMNRLAQFTFSDKQLNGLKKLWIPRTELNHCKSFKSRVEALAIRYRITYDLGCILSVPKTIYEHILEMFSISNKEYSIIEGFASPFNTSRRRYCSPFTEDILDFSSLGSFFNLNIGNKPCALLLNPPPNLVESVHSKLTSAFKTCKNLFVVLVTFDQDQKDQKNQKDQDQKDQDQKDQVQENSKFKIGQVLVDNQDAMYWDFVKSAWVIRANDQDTKISIFSSLQENRPAMPESMSSLVKIWKSIKN